jgi:hypothetical protein
MSITKHGVTEADALLEARAIAYVGRAILECFALSHSEFPDGPLYFVCDHQPFVASVPDESNLVTFLASAVRIGRPAQNDQAGSPEIKLEVDNVSGGLSELLALVRGSREPIRLTNYTYASDNPATLARTPPIVVDVKGASYDEQTSTLTCQFGDPGNLSFPGLTFKRDEYISLSRQS